MRKLSFVAVSLLLGLASAASATTASLRWTGASDAAVTGLGTNVVDVSLAAGPVLLTLDVIVDIDVVGLSAGGFDLQFDFDGHNELDLVSWEELSWANAKATRTLTQLSPGIVSTQESGSGGPEGQVFGFEAFTLGTGPSNLTLAFARIVFSADPGRAQNDGDDILTTNERDPFATVLFNNLGQPIQFEPLRASVIPEPGTVALLGGGLLALAAASRRRR